MNSTQLAVWEASPNEVGESPAVVSAGCINMGKPYVRLLLRVTVERSGSLRALPRLRSAAEVYRDFKCFADFDREVFAVILLDQKNRVVGVQVVSIGSVAASLVHPREVFKTALVANASAVIVIHNHPSGDPTPSREDREITNRLKAAGDIVGITLLDHVVIGGDGYLSLAEAGLL